MSIGSHHSAAAGTTTWLTPPKILNALGGWESFDLDPCAAPAPRPWPTAWRMNAEQDGDGLALDWQGRIWLNPPYSSQGLEAWMRKLADHGNGTALIFARTETEAFRRQIWERAHGILFVYGRLYFHDRDGIKAKANSGAPSVLCAYGAHDLEILAASEIDGALVPLKFSRFVMVAGIDQSWSQAMRDFLCGKPARFRFPTPIGILPGIPKRRQMRIGARRFGKNCNSAAGGSSTILISLPETIERENDNGNDNRSGHAQQNVRQPQGRS